MHGVFKRPSERAPARIGRLSVLPVFFDLNGKNALVAGGSEAALWKAELLAAAGARVHVFTPCGELCTDFAHLLEGGNFVHHDKCWSADAFAGMAIAVADAASEDEAKAFHATADAAGVPVNVIDRPEFCRFQFGSIVSRSPVVIGISTAGAAPILAQAIRRGIETLLPVSLAAWARWAQDMRCAINARLAAGAPRRAFWERFVRHAFERPFSEGEAAALYAATGEIASSTGQAHGKVTLVGAGPGEAELLTIRAVRALQAADVILFGEGMSGEVLELARREARRMRIDERESHAQVIAARMAELAGPGRHVVRLVAGDPMRRPRAAEIARLLEGAGITVEIVPGVAPAVPVAHPFADAPGNRRTPLRSVA